MYVYTCILTLLSHKNGSITSCSMYEAAMMLGASDDMLSYVALNVLLKHVSLETIELVCARLNFNPSVVEAMPEEWEMLRYNFFFLLPLLTSCM